MSKSVEEQEPSPPGDDPVHPEPDVCGGGGLDCSVVLLGFDNTKSNAEIEVWLFETFSGKIH